MVPTYFSLDIVDTFSEIADMASSLLHMKERRSAWVLVDISIIFDDFPIGFPTEVINLLQMAASQGEQKSL